MFDRKTSRLATLAAFVVFLLALAVPAPMHSAAPVAGQQSALTLSPVRAPGLGAAGAIPRIAASPLLDQLRQQGSASRANHLVDQQVLRAIQRDAQQARSATEPRAAGSPRLGAQAVPGQPASPIDRPAPGAALEGPVGRQVRPFVPGARSAPAQTSSNSCVNLISDSQVDDPANDTLWPVYAAKNYYEDPGFFYTSPPYAFLMVERGAPGYSYDDDDTVVDTSRPGSPDIDAFGQVIDVPSGTESITVSFNFRYDPGSAVAGDQLYYGFYSLNGSALGDEIAAFPIDVGSYANGGWWTQTTRFDDLAFLAAVQGQQVALVISTYNNVDSDYAVVRVDDIYATACQPPAAIKGKVTQAGASDLSDALILLGYFPPGGGDLQLLGLTFPDAAGNYQFDEVPELPTGGKYQIFFLNYSFTDAVDNTRVNFWAGPLINSLVASQVLTAPSFDIKDVTLGNPDSYTQQIMSTTQGVTFNWQSRGVNAAERYQFCIYDQQTVYPNTNDPVYLCTDVLPANDLDALINRTSFPSTYAFRYDHPYSWYIVVYGAGSDLQTSQSGLSFYEHVVTLKQSIASPPNSPPAPNPTPPPSQTGKAWTVMVYIAGDNNLGDPQRVPNPVSNLQGQWASLKALAAKYPNVNLVTLTDFYGNTGTQFCYLRPVGAPQCQELGEKNTADPATLADFVKRSRQLYPAQRTMLIISDHGHSIAGVATDETTTNAPSMAPDQIRQALANAGLGGATKLDILYYNTCLMGSFEVAFDASAYARYMVASPDLVWVLNQYDRLLPLLGSTDARAVAAGIVNAYGQSVDAIIPGSYRTMAAYDLDRAAAVNTALSALGQAMNTDLAGSRAAIAAIRTQAQVYDSSGNDLLDQVLDTSGVQVVAQEEDGIVDLRHLATLLKNSTNPALAAPIKTAANSLLTALGPVGGTPGQSFVIAAQQKTGEGDGGAPKNFANASGLGIFFPNGERFGGQLTLADAYLYQGLYAQLNNVTQWDDFLRSYLSGAIAQGRGGVVRGRGGVVRGAQPQAGGTVPLRIYLPVMRR